MFSMNNQNNQMISQPPMVNQLQVGFNNVTRDQLEKSFFHVIDGVDLVNRPNDIRAIRLNEYEYILYPSLDGLNFSNTFTHLVPTLYKIKYYLNSGIRKISASDPAFKNILESCSKAKSIEEFFNSTWWEDQNYFFKIQFGHLMEAIEKKEAIPSAFNPPAGYKTFEIFRKSGTLAPPPAPIAQKPATPGPQIPPPLVPPPLATLPTANVGQIDNQQKGQAVHCYVVGGTDLSKKTLSIYISNSYGQCYVVCEDVFSDIEGTDSLRGSVDRLRKIFKIIAEIEASNVKDWSSSPLVDKIPTTRQISFEEYRNMPIRNLYDNTNKSELKISDIYYLKSEGYIDSFINRYERNKPLQKLYFCAEEGVDVNDCRILKFRGKVRCQHTTEEALHSAKRLPRFYDKEETVYLLYKPLNNLTKVTDIRKRLLEISEIVRRAKNGGVEIYESSYASFNEKAHDKIREHAANIKPYEGFLNTLSLTINGIQLSNGEILNFNEQDITELNGWITNVKRLRKKKVTTSAAEYEDTMMRYRDRINAIINRNKALYASKLSGSVGSAQPRTMQSDSSLGRFRMEFGQGFGTIPQQPMQNQGFGMQPLTMPMQSGFNRGQGFGMQQPPMPMQSGLNQVQGFGTMPQQPMQGQGNFNQGQGFGMQQPPMPMQSGLNQVQGFGTMPQQPMQSQGNFNQGQGFGMQQPPMPMQSGLNQGQGFGTMPQQPMQGQGNLNQGQRFGMQQPAQDILNHPLNPTNMYLPLPPQQNNS